MLSGLPLLSDVSEISVLILAVNTNFLYLNLFFFFKSCFLIVVFFFKTAIYCLKLVFQSFCHLLCFDIFLKVFCAIRGAICFYVNDQATISGQAIIKNSRGYFMVKPHDHVLFNAHNGCKNQFEFNQYHEQQHFFKE